MNPESRPPAILIASVALDDDHAIHLTVETRKGRPAATLRLWTRLYSPRAKARTMMATKRALSVETGSLPALADAIIAAHAALIADAGVQA